MCMADDADLAEFYKDTQRRARKAHKCDECYRQVAPGETYFVTFMYSDGEGWTFKRCAHCEVLRVWLSKECRSWLCGGIVEDVEEHVREGGVSAYGYGVARLVVGARNQWRAKRGGLVPVPACPATTHDRPSPQEIAK